MNALLDTELSPNKMRFFTPELLVRLNSPDDAVAHAAESTWDTVLQQYEQELADVVSQAPTSIRELADLCLHDAELQLFHPDSLSNGKSNTPNDYHGIAALLLKTEDSQRVSLLFDLVAPPILDRAEQKSGDMRLYWLYEELRRIPNTANYFELRVLLSDHSTLTLPFTSVSIVRYEEGKHSPFPEPLRQSA